MEDLKTIMLFIMIGILMIFAFPISAQYTDTLSQNEIQEKVPTASFPAMGLELKNILSPNYAQHSLLDAKYPVKKEGIFCRWEDRIIQKSRVPVKFRLGSLQYADQLEGKVDFNGLYSNHRP